MGTPAGWHPDPDDATQLRYWNGETWTEERTAVPPDKIDDDQRKAVLQSTILNLTNSGYRVESMTDYQAALVKGKPVNHVLHLLLTFLTCSLWGFVWLTLVLTGGEKRVTVAVDERGYVHRRTS